MVLRVFLTTPNKRGNMKRARVVELIKKFNDNLELDPIRCQFKISFEVDDSSFGDSLSYNDILDYIERKYNNEDGNLWKFRKVIGHSLISGKRGVVNDRIGVQMQYRKLMQHLQNALRYSTPPVEHVIYTKKSNLIEEE